MNDPEGPHDQATQEALARLSQGMRAIAQRIVENEENDRKAVEHPPPRVHKKAGGLAGGHPAQHHRRTVIPDE